MPDNLLYYGDNLDIMQRYIRDESVDLVYLDPPFNSNQTYNVLFAEQDKSRSAAQSKAFEDTWTWNPEAEHDYFKVVEEGGRVSEVMQAFRRFLPDKSTMMAYLAMMAPRLKNLHRVLKPTGSIYLHCDPTASHYLKILMDATFGAEDFLNEIIWKRTTAHSSAKRFGPVHDVLLYYSKGGHRTWNRQYQPHGEDYIAEKYNHEDGGRLYTLSDLSAAGVRHGSSGRSWGGIDPTVNGNHWKFTIEHLDELNNAGRIYWPPKGGVPRYKRYLDEMQGIALQDIWDDIPPLNSQAAERLGYPTQKPEALLARIIGASTNEGDTVLDPFCGCGTAVAVAQRLNRRWIGIDITHLAITLIKSRLRDAFGDGVTYSVLGEPVSLPDAADLAASDPYQFQWWALGLVAARPVEQKKGADRGIDGRLYFHDESDDGKTKQVIFSVKAGNLQAGYVRDLRGVIEGQKAEMGVLITMHEPTQPMRREAASAGFYHSPTWNRDYPRMQIVTVADLLEGKGVEMPPVRQVNQTFRRAPRARGEQAETLRMPLE